MRLASPRVVKEILAKQSIKPSRGLGQNFLIDGNVVKKLADTANIDPNDTVLEIGPGIGTLTQELAPRAKKVIAVEKDRKMVEILKETLAGLQNIEIVCTDVLKLDTQPKDCSRGASALGGGPPRAENYKVVANLPYYITAPVIRKFLEGEHKPACAGRPESLTLIVQKEVAQRICAKPPDMNILAVSVQIYAVPEIIAYIKKTSFWPQPKVDAAILQITPLAHPYPIHFPKFFTIVKAGFKQPRKQLVNNLSVGFGFSRQKTEQWLYKNNIHSTRRAETLSLQDWINLANTL